MKLPLRERIFITGVFVCAEIPNVFIPHPQQALFFFLGVIAIAGTWLFT